jgi:uroporphyrinogen decarboxylase
MHMSTMSKKERLLAAVAGDPVDRVPIALWRHWPGDDQRAIALARATLDFQNTWDFDFVKCMPSSNYCVADWGLESTWLGNEEGTRHWGPQVIHQPEDWSDLPLLDPYRGALAESCRALELIGQGLGPDTPFIQTIFSPLYQAAKLAGPGLMPHLRQHPQPLKAGLETITQSTIRFIEAAQGTGMAGVFLALQHATYDRLSEAEYLEFGRPYDLRILKAAEGLWFNVLHLHGSNVMFDLVSDYPVQAVNWHDRETWPSLAQALPRFGGALIGGLHRIETMLRGSPEQVEAEVTAAMEQASESRLIIGTGCVMLVNTPLGSILTARSAVNR